MGGGWRLEVANDTKKGKIIRFIILYIRQGRWGRRGLEAAKGMRSMGQSELTLSIIGSAENMRPDNGWHT